jgi:hypothetical protein
MKFGFNFGLREAKLMLEGAEFAIEDHFGSSSCPKD